MRIYSHGRVYVGEIDASQITITPIDSQPLTEMIRNQLGLDSEGMFEKHIYMLNDALSENRGGLYISSESWPVLTDNIAHAKWLTTGELNYALSGTRFTADQFHIADSDLEGN